MRREEDSVNAGLQQQHFIIRQIKENPIIKYEGAGQDNF